MQGDVDRHLEIVKVLSQRAARPKLSGARADDLIINAEFRHAGAFDPLREEISQVAAGNLIGQPFEVVNGRVLVAILLQVLPHQLGELLLAQSLAQHAKHHRTFVIDDRLIRGRLIVER